MSIDIYPSKLSRIIMWIAFNILIFFAVAITNGLVVFAIGLLSSCLLSAWMLTAFVFQKDRIKKLPTPMKVLLVIPGILLCIGFAYGHPLYIALILGVVIHEMRILNRYDLGAISTLCSPVVSLLPIIFISHASYTPLTLSYVTYPFEAIVGYVTVTVLLLVAITMIKKDDRRLLPLLGKSEDKYGFEKVGVPKWIFARLESKVTEEGEKRMDVSALNLRQQQLRHSIFEKAAAQSRQNKVDIVAEAEQIAVNCGIFDKERNPARYVDVVLQLLAYPNELACSIVHQFTNFAGRMAYNPFGTTMVAFARMDSLYPGVIFRVKMLRKNPLLGEAVVSKEARLQRCGEILAISLLALSQTVEDAKQIYRTTPFDPSIREVVDKTLRQYDVKIADYITGIA